MKKTSLKVQTQYSSNNKEFNYDKEAKTITFTADMIEDETRVKITDLSGLFSVLCGKKENIEESDSLLEVLRITIAKLIKQREDLLEKVWNKIIINRLCSMKMMAPNH